MAALGAALVVGCGDDDGGSEEENGGSGDSGDSGGSAGSKAGGATGGTKAGSATGGSSSGGTKAGSSNGGATSGGSGAEAGGSNGEDRGGEGGGTTEPMGGAGVAGQGGEGGGDVTFAPITPLSEGVFTEANDLRGLRFSSALPGKLWASGHVGINTNPSTAGQPDKTLVIARFNADGSPDESFDGDGFLQVNLVERVEAADVVTNDGNEESLGIVELANGDVVVAANVRDENGKGMDAVVARFTAAGAKVEGFGDEGVALVTLGWAPADDASWPTAGAAPSDNSWGLELDKHGNQERLVVFAGGSAPKGSTAGNPAVQRTDSDRYVTRLLAATGAPDPEFNGGKAFTYNTGGTNGDNGRRGVVNADGSIVAGGYTNFPGLGNHVVAIRLKADGTRDTSFGFGIPGGGVVSSNPLINDGGAAECYGLTVQSTGRIVTTGYGSATANASTLSSFGFQSTKGPDLVTLGISADGKSLDTTFAGGAGFNVLQSEELVADRFEDRGRDVVALSDDRLVYVGNFATDPAIYVTLPDGEFDPINHVGNLFRFEPLTTTTTANGVSTSHFFRVVVSPDGKQIAAATNQNIDGALVVRLKVGE